MAATTTTGCLDKDDDEEEEKEEEDAVENLERVEKKKEKRERANKAQGRRAASSSSVHSVSTPSSAYHVDDLLDQVPVEWHLLLREMYTCRRHQQDWEMCSVQSGLRLFRDMSDSNHQGYEANPVVASDIMFATPREVLRRLLDHTSDRGRWDPNMHLSGDGASGSGSDSGSDGDSNPLEIGNSKCDTSTYFACPLSTRVFTSRW